MSSSATVLSDTGHLSCIFDALDLNLSIHILSFLDVRSICKAACACRFFKSTSLQSDLWEAILSRDYLPVERHICPESAASVVTSIKSIVIKALHLHEIRFGKWDRIHQSAQSRPHPREGHAASSWGEDGMILFGGWGGGIRNDTWLLHPCHNGDDGVEYVWGKLQASGRPPAIRYGHSITRCGANKDMLLVYGGMQSGGYYHEIESPSILRSAVRGSDSEDVSIVGSSEEAEHSGKRNKSCLYEWYHPTLSGDSPGPRGYHASCASDDGRLVYLFGGIAARDSCNTLAVIDVHNETCLIPDTSGEQPSPRFGCSLACYDNKLWVVGGGCGYDLARSGHDLEDVYCLDLKSWEWCKVELTNQPSDPRCIGRCHAYQLIGSKLLMFGGSMDLGNEVSYLDLAIRSWGKPAVIGQPPNKRMSAVMVLQGTQLLVYGGWIYSHGEMGDLYRLNLQLGSPEDRALAVEVEQKNAMSPVAPPTASASEDDQEGSESRNHVVQDKLNAAMALYYRLMREGQEASETNGSIPPALLHLLHRTMSQIRVMQTLLGGEMLSNSDQEEEEDEVYHDMDEDVIYSDGLYDDDEYEDEDEADNSGDDDDDVVDGDEEEQDEDKADEQEVVEVGLHEENGDEKLIFNS
ncbi:hypothetical protein CEUSTIGMA_g8547.t1 [Chlamydomonas eustigma]|uniref:F-box domain-containing protein n=1 Tax=Chlamydomonas eustigma TaxID=1157962 RepID=A0A250XDF4_9CHLO|nr:hypothetical protein CEUSTIGMA_g8547.t1 [Chlamydomonas eustigma]|eukprot:GAX81113.1 hypothetical protein CEUSTIGMA_g8547.t1 [Chlamydomonas eustigma]